MNVTLLRAIYENSDHNDTYAFTGKKSYTAALRHALELIAFYVDGDWEPYAAEAIFKFRAFVEGGQLAEAVEQWNSMSTLQLIIEDTSSYTIRNTTKPDFKWPGEVDDD